MNVKERLFHDELTRKLAEHDCVFVAAAFGRGDNFVGSWGVTFRNPQGETRQLWVRLSETTKPYALGTAQYVVAQLMDSPRRPRATQAQLAAGQRNWAKLQIMGARGNLGQLARQGGLTDHPEAHMIQEKLAHVRSLLDEILQLWDVKPPGSTS